MLRSFIAVGVFLLLSQQASAAPADEIRSLVEQGKAGDAYQLSKQHLEEFGNPAFDFYFGIAAIDTGHAGEGVLAFERYLLNFPDNVSARLQLARGYVALGEDARAREEFEDLRKLNPPPDVAATIDRYLDAVRLRETRYSMSTGLYAELGFGTDSNVNAGVANASIFLPNLGNVVVAQSGTQTRDNFTHLGLGGYISYPLKPGIALFGNAQTELKLNQSATQYSQGTYSASGGVSILHEKNLFRFGLDDNLITLGNGTQAYRAYFGGSGEWQYQIDERQAFSAGAQVGRLRYPGDNSPKDANSYGLSAGYRKLFSHDWKPLVSVALNYGREDTLDSSRQDLARNFVGGRIGVSVTPAAKWGISAGYSFQNSRYLAPDLLLGLAREDKYSSFDATVNYLYSRNISFRLEASTSKNRSNIDLYAFPRDLVAFKVRYEFK